MSALPSQPFAFVDVTTRGAELVTPSGEFIAWFEDTTDAIAALKRHPAGTLCRRCSDGALLATAARLRGRR